MGGLTSVEQRKHSAVRPFAAGFIAGIGSGFVVGSLIVGVFGSDLFSAVRQLISLVRRSDDDHVNFELLLQ